MQDSMQDTLYLIGYMSNIKNILVHKFKLLGTSGGVTVSKLD